MKELINVKEENGQKLVSARDLHKGLEIGTPFHKWMPRMIEYGFIENTDYLVTDIFVLNSNGGRQTQKEYIISLDMAKHISMIQRSELGMKFRNYFIECEKQVKSGVPKLSKKEELGLKIMKGGSTSLVAMKELIEIERQEEREIAILMNNRDSKIIPLQTVIQLLNINKLTSTIFNEWLVAKGHGKWVKFEGESKRTFQPNDSFLDLIKVPGYSFTGVTNEKGKIKVVYSDRMVNVIRDSGLYNELENFCKIYCMK